MQERAGGASAAPAVDGRIPVVYVMGYGRSGSTVLAAALGAHPAAFALGEALHLARAVTGGEERCSCGERAARCPFWSAVLERWRPALGAEGLEGHARLQRRLELGRAPTLACLAGRPPGGTAFGAWSRATAALFAAVRDESGARVLVDASKSPARARLLAAVPALDPFLVHLVRDGRGVAWSLARPFAADAGAGVETALPARSPARTALAWSVVNRACERAALRVPAERRLLLRYEDYVADLPAALAPLEPFVGPGLVELAERIAAGAELSPGHAVAGNRLRLGGPLALRPDVRWRVEMHARQRGRVGRLAGGLLRRYGYER